LSEGHCALSPLSKFRRFVRRFFILFARHIWCDEQVTTIGIPHSELSCRFCLQFQPCLTSFSILLDSPCSMFEALTNNASSGTSLFLRPLRVHFYMTNFERTGGQTVFMQLSHETQRAYKLFGGSCVDRMLRTRQLIRCHFMDWFHRPNLDSC